MAGFKVLFFVTNCLINKTDQNLFMFYEKPDGGKHVSATDIENMVTFPFEMDVAPGDGLSGAKIHMLSTCKELFARMEDSVDVSKEILTHPPGTIDRFELVKRNRLMQFGYATEMYLAHKEEFIYTKITTISPYFVVVNYS